MKKSMRLAIQNLPQFWAPIANWVCELECIRAVHDNKDKRYVTRLERLVDHRNESIENSEKLDKAVRALTKNAINKPAGDSLLSIFMGLPDKADSQPFTGLSYGVRIVDPTSQRESYLELAKHADALLEFFMKHDSLERLLADQANEWDEDTRLPKTKTASEIKKNAKEASDLYQVKRGSPLVELRWLSCALKGTNPHRWYPSRQPLAEDARRKSYIKLLADLNRYVCKTQHSALATLANANSPQQKVTPDELRKAWKPPIWWPNPLKAGKLSG